MLSNKFIIEPLTFFDYYHHLLFNISKLSLVWFGIINISTPSISHSFFPLPNIVVSVSNYSSSKSIPFIINVLAFIYTIFTFSSQSRTRQLTVFIIVFGAGELSMYPRVKRTVLKLNLCIN